MIHLDSNYLILANRIGTKEASDVQHWLEQDEVMATSAIAWMEFVTGPVTPDTVDSIRHALGDRIIAFNQEESELAAELYNIAGRRRGLRYDCMIASVALNAGARLATRNTADYKLFVSHGLKFATRD